MSLLSKVISGKQSKPFRLMIAGIAGVGKSSFAAGAPKPRFLDCERRTEHLDVARLVINSWEELTEALKEVYLLAKEGKCPYQTVVVDTLDHAEALLWQSLCKKYRAESIEEVAGGYGKWVNIALAEWRKFVLMLDALRDVGMNSIFIAHCEMRTVNLPEGESFDAWVIKLQKRAAGLLTEKMDAAGFATFDDTTLKKRGELKAKASAGGRVLRFGHHPAYYTKQGLGLPEQLELSFEAVAKAMKNGSGG